MNYRLKVGEYFMRRNGRGPFLFHEPTNKDPEYPFEAGCFTYTAKGFWLSDDIPSRYDLVEHVPRTDTRHPEYGTENI